MESLLDLIGGMCSHFYLSFAPQDDEGDDFQPGEAEEEEDDEYDEDDDDEDAPPKRVAQDDGSADRSAKRPRTF